MVLANLRKRVCEVRDTQIASTAIAKANEA
jgi:hypothetical protein